MKNLKDDLLTHCLQIIEGRISSTQADLKKTQDSANNETKSAMGDKYETGRAMAQNEKQKLQMSLSNLLTQKKTLSQIKSSTSEEIGFGSVVKTSKQNLFLSIPLGEVTINEEKFYALSPVSPIGKALSGKKVKEDVLFNGNTISILSVEN